MILWRYTSILYEQLFKIFFLKKLNVIFYKICIVYFTLNTKLIVYICKLLYFNQLNNSTVIHLQKY